MKNLKQLKQNKENEIDEIDVTFPIIQLPDGTELIFIPHKDWDWLEFALDYACYRRIKK